jgi:hypothetical protein
MKCKSLVINDSKELISETRLKPVTTCRRLVIDSTLPEVYDTIMK